MNNKIMSISNQVKYFKTINGITWICAGIFDIFDGIFFSAITCIMLIISVILQLTVSFANKESDDELSSLNRIKAGADTQSIMHIIFCAASVVLLLLTRISFISTAINWKQLIVPMFFIIIGLENFVWGICFKKHEEE